MRHPEAEGSLPGGGDAEVRSSVMTGVGGSVSRGPDAGSAVGKAVVNEGAARESQKPVGTGQPPLPLPLLPFLGPRTGPKSLPWGLSRISAPAYRTIRLLQVSRGSGHCSALWLQSGCGA